MALGFVLSVCPPRWITTPGTHLLAELDLPEGEYIVFAKAEVGLSSTAPFDGGGFARLKLGGREDEIWGNVEVTGAKRATICLNLGAQLAAPDKVQLYYGTGGPGLPLIVSQIKISAIGLDKVRLIDIPCEPLPPPPDFG